MNINQSNYAKAIASIGSDQLSPVLKGVHDFLEQITKSFTDWSLYQTYKKTFDLQFEAVELLLDTSGDDASEQPSGKKTPSTATPKSRQQLPSAEKVSPKKAVEDHVKDQKPNKHTSVNPIPKSDARPTSKSNEANEVIAPGTTEQVELISPEIGFIRRFSAWQNKRKTKDQIGSFIRSLQKAITEKRIRKTSPHAFLINWMQKELIERFNAKGKPKPFEFTERQSEALRQTGTTQVVYPSIPFIKSFIGLNGKEISKEKAQVLRDRIVRAIDKAKLTKRDRYFKQIEAILSVLAAFVKGKGKTSAPHTLMVSEAQLNGLQGILKECGCHSAEGKGALPPTKREDARSNALLSGMAAPENEWRYKGTLMNSVDFAGMHFETIGFEGKWRELIGDPSKGFTAIVYGKPKFGKSYFCMDWAGYLAQRHGRVLYIAHEEKLDATLQKKMKDMEAKNERLDVSDYLPLDLSGYDFVFLDSISSLRLKPEELIALEDQNPGISFIYIMHVNKLGQAKGSNDFVHNVDAVVEVPEKGKAVQFGRFNQGGELEIFS